jgi:hypothetical protein
LITRQAKAHPILIAERAGRVIDARLFVGEFEPDMETIRPIMGKGQQDRRAAQVMAGAGDAQQGGGRFDL